MAADKDYSATPLAQKLGAKPGAGVVVFFTTSGADLESRFAALKETLDPVMGSIDSDVLAHVAASTTLAGRIRAPEHLQAWIARASDEAEAYDRPRQARGLLLEMLHFGLRVGRASGRRFGNKLSDEEFTAWVSMGAALELPQDWLATVLATTGGR